MARNSTSRRRGRHRTASRRSGRTVGHRRSANRAKANRWSQRVTRTSDALDLEKDVFKLTSPKAIASSLRRSALRSKRRKAAPFQSAMSMLNFYINRGGRGLSASQKRVLQRAKGELRRAFGRADRT